MSKIIWLLVKTESKKNLEMLKNYQKEGKTLTFCNLLQLFWNSIINLNYCFSYNFWRFVVISDMQTTQQNTVKTYHFSHFFHALSKKSQSQNTVKSLVLPLLTICSQYTILIVANDNKVVGGKKRKKNEYKFKYKTDLRLHQ